MPLYNFKAVFEITQEGRIYASNEEEAREKLEQYEHYLEDVTVDNDIVEETYEILDIYKEEE